jgi:hypothetical protein
MKHWLFRYPLFYNNSLTIANSAALFRILMVSAYWTTCRKQTFTQVAAQRSKFTNIEWLSFERIFFALLLFGPKTLGKFQGQIHEQGEFCRK